MSRAASQQTASPDNATSRKNNKKMDALFWSKVSKKLASSGLKLPGENKEGAKPPGGADCRRRWNDLERSRVLSAVAE